MFVTVPLLGLYGKLRSVCVLFASFFSEYSLQMAMFRHIYISDYTSILYVSHKSLSSVEQVRCAKNDFHLCVLMCNGLYRSRGALLDLLWVLAELNDEDVFIKKRQYFFIFE